MLLFNTTCLQDHRLVHAAIVFQQSLINSIHVKT